MRGTTYDDPELMVLAHDDAREEEYFQAWMRDVDKILLATVGLTSLDLPDQTWHDWYDDRLSPYEAISNMEDCW